jgi:hypothetical protein
MFACIAFIGEITAMMRQTGADPLGLVPVPLRDAHASGSCGHEQRLATDIPWLERTTTAAGRTTKVAFLAIALIALAVSFVAVPVSYAIHRHLHPLSPS